MTKLQPPINILTIEDGKPGHMSQLIGLMNNIKLKTNIEVESVKANLGIKPHLKSQIKPNIVIGAGHRTHLSVLKLALKYDAMSVILMKPTLPLFLFDAVICPKHDQIKQSEKVFLTQGTINKFQTTCNQRNQRSEHLILLGGQSKLYQWDSLQIAQQIEIICSTDREIPWKIIPSRRTPDEIIQKLTQVTSNSNACIESTDSDTYASLLINSKMTWVTPDSQSMLYESLSAFCPTGVLELDPTKKNKAKRIAKEIDRLVGEKKLLKFSEWSKQQDKANQLNTALAPKDFNEADKAAEWLLNRYNQFFCHRP